VVVVVVVVVEVVAVVVVVVVIVVVVVSGHLEYQVSVPSHDSESVVARVK
jgi:hypothetical protein